MKERREVAVAAILRFLAHHERQTAAEIAAGALVPVPMVHTYCRQLVQTEEVVRDLNGYDIWVYSITPVGRAKIQ